MAPYPRSLPLDAGSLERRQKPDFGDWRNIKNPEGFIIEAWGEGCMFGALMIMAVITIANMRKGVFLHKLILFEVCHTAWLLSRKPQFSWNCICPGVEPTHGLVHAEP